LSPRLELPTRVKFVCLAEWFFADEAMHFTGRLNIRQGFNTGR